MKHLFLILLIAGCGHFRSVEETDAPDRLETVAEVQDGRIARARTLLDANGWIVPRDCDGFHWSGKFGAGSVGLIEFNPVVAEYPDEPGRFSRRGSPYCWTEELGNQGSDTTWSRDAFVIGLGPWAWRTGNLDLLNRHEEYGRTHTWQMGQPFADGRVVYTPQVFGMLYQMIYALGGDDNGNRHWPSTYPSGLDDFEAHLQVMSIVIRGEISQKQGDLDALPKQPNGLVSRLWFKTAQGEEIQEFVDGAGGIRLLSINEIMYERLKEHADREPDCPMYQAAFAVYSGAYDRAIELCEMDSPPICSYVRCEEEERCKLADDVFACDLILRRLKSDPS